MASTALEAHKLESRTWRTKDRQKVHYGDKTPVSLHQATAAPLDPPRCSSCGRVTGR